MIWRREYDSSQYRARNPYVLKYIPVSSFGFDPTDDYLSQIANRFFGMIPNRLAHKSAPIKY
jgi:hypothetical protein